MGRYCPPETYTVFKGTDREFTGNKAEIAKHFGIKRNAFYARIRDYGYSIEEAIDWEGKKDNFVKYTVFKGTNREFTGNMVEIARNFGIKYRTLLARIRYYGYSLEEAIDLKGMGKCSVKYTVFKGTDKEFTGNQIEIAEHFGIGYSTFNNRIRAGYSIEEAVNWNGCKYHSNI